MKLQGVFVVLLGWQLCQPAVSGALFKCEVNGRVEYSDRRCQPAKPTCSERQEFPNGQCATSSLEMGKPPVVSAVAQSRTGSGPDWPARLAFNETGGSPDGKSRVADPRYSGASSQKVGGRTDSEGRK